MKIKNTIKKESTRYILFLVLTGIFFIFLLNLIFAATPQGPDSLISVNNSTKGNVVAKEFNISGGYIATFNLSATIQNIRWKAFIGNVTGSFTLDDETGATIYDWTLSTITGRIYTTRNSSTISWGLINCSNNTYLELENIAMSHSNVDDNLTKTFQNRTHDPFWVASNYISSNSCPTLRTYVNDVAQDSDFQETALYDGVTTVYATILENNQEGYDGKNYDFQMIVPENGAPGFGSSTAYYLYVELG